MKAALAALALCATCALAADRIKLVLDTDLGQDFDDAWALSYLATRSDVFDFRLVLSATRNTTGRALLAAKMLEVVGRSDVPVAVGTPTPIDNIPHGVGAEWPWVGNFTFEDYSGTVMLDGISALEAELRAASPSNPVWIVEIAPTGTIGALLARSPELAANARIYAMSGSVLVGYNLNPPISAEYNVKENITTSQVMYAAHWAAPTVTAPVDTSAYFQVTGSAYAEFYKAATDPSDPAQYQLARMLLENYQVWYDNGGKNHGAIRPFTPSTASSPCYDAQAAYMAACAAESQVLGSSNCTHFQFPSLVTEPFHLFVDSQGYTRINATADPSEPLFYPAVNFTGGDRLAGSNYIGQHIVDWLVRGV